MLKRLPTRTGTLARLFQSDAPFAELARYFFASGIALAIDFTLLVALTELAGWHYFFSSAVGFLAGSVCLYLLSITAIFSARRLNNAGAELGVFVTIGLMGLAINQTSMIALVEFMGLVYPIAKVCTVGTVFFFNFALRKRLLFHVLTTQSEHVR